MLSRFLISLFLLVFQGTFFSQNLRHKYTYIKDASITYWVPDNVGNIYIYGKDILGKTSNGQLPSFSQSIKAMGEIEQILPVNALKTLIFSETQQQLCFIDNTLSINGNCIDLEEFNIQNALFCATSSRPNLIYAYDQMNSSIFLIDIQLNSIVQTVSNLEGLMDLSLDLSEIREHNNSLFMRTGSNVVYELDMFLNLKRKLPSSHEGLLFWKEYVVDFYEDRIVLKHLISEENKIIPLGDIRAQDLKINGNSFYFSTAEKIMVYELIPH